MAVRKEMVPPRPAEPHEEIVETTCDICKRTVSHDATGDHHHGGWTRDSYHPNAVVMKHETGDRYPEGTTIKSEVFDVCPKCWREVIVPLMAAHGAKPRKESFSY